MSRSGQATQQFRTVNPPNRASSSGGSGPPGLGCTNYANSAAGPVQEIPPPNITRPPGSSLFDPARGALAQNFQPNGYCHEDGPCHDSIYLPDISGGDFARAGTAIADWFQRLARWLTPAAEAVPKFVNPKFAALLEQQLTRDGSKSIFKSLRSLEGRLAEHEAKLPGFQYKSSVEREIRAFKDQIETLKQFIEHQGLKP